MGEHPLRVDQTAAERVRYILFGHTHLPAEISLNGPRAAQESLAACSRRVLVELAALGRVDSRRVLLALLTPSCQTESREDQA